MNDRFDYDLVCIGSGPAGQRAAVQAAKIGRRALVLEREPPVGGVCLQTGTIPSKSFREAVKTLNARAQGDGLAPQRRPSIEDLSSRIRDVVLTTGRIEAEQLRRNEVEVRFGTASFVTPHVVRIDGPDTSEQVSSEFVLVATGSRPARPPAIDIDGRTVLVSDDLLDLEEIPHRMVVVGAGVIGIELASMFAALGVEVTVVDKRERLLDFVDDEIVDELIYQMRQNRVTFRLGERVEEVRTMYDPRPQAMLELESGKHIVEDVVLFSAGRVGNIDLLNLDAVGLKADDRGRLEVDDDYRTAAASIYAAGDVIGFPALASTSSEQGRLAACHMFDVEAKPMADRFPFGIYAMPEISMIGATEETLTAARVPYETGVARYRELVRGQLLHDDTGLLKMLFHRDDGRLLGVHIIGTFATELLHVGQAVYLLDGGLDFFLQNVFNYPTLAEAYKVAALDAANKLSAVHRFARSAV